MRTVGLIVEYNPLHNGHRFHYEASKQAAGADACVAVMSGHFLQRGEPALVGKWARAEMALRMGADLVLELPTAYSSQPAEWFAYGAVRTLHETGVVDALCFGSEDGRIEPLLRLARQLHQEPAGFRARLLDALATGASYPAAYAVAAGQLAADSGDAEADRKSARRDEGCATSPEADLSILPSSMQSNSQPDIEPDVRLDKPNNSLGLHYLIALERLNSPIEPLTIPRRNAEYHQTTVTHGSIASATAIRKLILGGALEDAAPYLPASTLEILRREWAAGRGPVTWESFRAPLFTQLLGRSAEELGQLQEMTEGLEHRIKRVLRQMPSGTPPTVEALLTLLKTKRYTWTKLQRTLLRVLLQHPKHELTRQQLSEGPGYIRVLGFSSKGRQLLKRMKASARLPVLTKLPERLPPFLDMDVRASSIYSLAYAAAGSDEWLRDYYQAPLQAEPAP